MCVIVISIKILCSQCQFLLILYWVDSKCSL